MNDLHWLALQATVAFLFGRALKWIPGMSKTWLPFIVLACGYAAMVGLGLYHGSTWTQALTYAWTGLYAGVIAIGYNDFLKAFFTRVLGKDVAVYLLGRLEAGK